MVSDMREAYPEEYGGAGLSYVTYIGVCEMLAKYCASTSVTVSAHTSLCSWPIFAFGTEEQKQKYLVALAPGEKIGCSAAAFFRFGRMFLRRHPTIFRFSRRCTP